MSEVAVAENPLLEMWRAVYGEPSEPESFFARMLSDSTLVVTETDVRYKARLTYSFAIPNDAALDEIAKHGPVVEMGAGTGYWARLLADRGVDVIAYDYRPPQNAGLPDASGHPQERNSYFLPISHYDVRECDPDCSVLRDHADRALLLVWPPVSSMAARCLKMWEGKTVIYVGEWRGSTADERFHKALSAEFSEVGQVAIPQWFGLNDYLSVWDRRAAE